MTAIIILIGIVVIISLVFSLMKKPANIFYQPTSNIQTTTIHPKKYLISIFDGEKGLTSLAGIRYHKTSNKLDFKLNDQVYLVPEPDNIHDRNAIKVLTKKGIKIGYIPKLNNTEILDLMEEGYFFIVRISIINLDEPDYPFAMLELTKTKNQQAIPLTNDEISEINNKSIEVVEKYDLDSQTAYELTKKGLELEKASEVTEAIEYFEEAIKLPQTPTIAFTRLVVNYRKKKDYSNEIRVLYKNIESVQNSKAYDYIKKDEIKEIRNRIKKAELLRNNSFIP